LSIETLDFRGEPCPGPLVKTIRKISSMSSGSELVILTDIEDCVKIIRETLELLGVKSINITHEKNYWIIHVKN